MKAQKKPVVIDFFEIIPNTETLIPDLEKFVQSFGDKFEDVFLTEYDGEFSSKPPTILVKTLEGTSYELSSNDVLIRGQFGEYYPCKKFVFTNSYQVL